MTCSEKDEDDAPAAVAHRFAALWNAIKLDEGRERAEHQQRLLIDQVRNALDRGSSRLTGRNPTFIANTFSVEQCLYRSDTTEVLKLRHRDFGTSHVLKTAPEQQGQNTPLLALLLREAQIALALDHPCIAKTVTLLRLEDGRPGLLQDWHGLSLAAAVKTGLLADPGPLTVIERMLDALDCLHGSGYVHCDVTPANILLPDSNPARAVLNDLGIALRIGERHAALGLGFCGSPEFAPPEQGGGEPADPKQDIFALGRVARYLLDYASSRPTDRTRLQHFAELCTKADPDERPPTAQAAAAAWIATRS